MIGGLLTDHYSIRSIFWFLFIYAAVTIPLLMVLVPESPFRVRQRIDVLGALLLGTGVSGVLIYLSEGEGWGWTRLSCLGYLIGGLVLLVASHPFQLVAAPPGGKPVIQNVPQVYTAGGFVEVYLIIGGIAGLAVLILGLVLRAGREPARGGLAAAMHLEVETSSA